MGTTKVKAPDPSFEGSVAGVLFKDGVGEFDPKEQPGALGYFQSAGYEVGGKTLVADPPGRYARQPEPAAPAPGTPDNPEGVTRGAPLRDAAVEPHRDDFLVPTNAGEADPHGPRVVAPGIHALPPAPIVPGQVSGDAKRQDATETAVAAAVLVDETPVPSVMGAIEAAHRAELERSKPDPDHVDVAAAASSAIDTEPGPDTRPTGPLGLSDPASAAAGIAAARESDVPSAADLREASTAPAKRAKIEAWRDYAVARGASPEEAAELNKDQLIERYG